MQFIHIKYFLFQVGLTCLELFVSNSHVITEWPLWGKVLNDLSNVLLVIYSALNPLAYCGGLIFKTIRCLFRRGSSSPQQRNGIFNSEYGAMKSIGITLNGPDPLNQQLQELDAQSRLMCGLSKASS